MVSWFQSCTTQVSAISPNGVNFSLKTYRLLASMLPGDDEIADIPNYCRDSPSRRSTWWRTVTVSRSSSSICCG